MEKFFNWLEKPNILATVKTITDVGNLDLLVAGVTFSVSSVAVPVIDITFLTTDVES